MTKKHDIIWFERIDSTNEEARRHISDIDNLSVLSASEQTAGRGQRGNTWTSSPGENLLFSIVLKFGSGCQGKTLPPLPAERQFAISQIGALSVCDFLHEHGIEAKIKWPNDIYVGEKKICGMLIENSSRGKHISSSIIGIGLNVNQKNFDVNLPNPTSMVLCGASDEPISIHRCLEEFMDIFTTYTDSYISAPEDILVQLREEYLSRLWRLREPAAFLDYTTLPSGHLDGPMNISTQGNIETPDIPFRFDGIIKGISGVGNLLIEDLSSGLVREFGFKEIGYIL